MGALEDLSALGASNAHLRFSAGCKLPTWLSSSVFKREFVAEKSLAASGYGHVRSMKQESGKNMHTVGGAPGFSLMNVGWIEEVRLIVHSICHWPDLSVIQQR